MACYENEVKIWRHRENCWMDNPEFDPLPQTSPIHKPTFELDFDLALSLQSPLSAPIYANNISPTGLFDKFEDPALAIPATFNDVAIQTKPAPKLPQTKTKDHQKKKPRHVYRPFVSFEASELTVHQLRSLLSQPRKRSQKATESTFTSI